MSTADSAKFVRVPTLKTPAQFRSHLASLGVDIPCDDQVETGPGSPLAQPVDGVRINGKRIGNRFAVQPMEGWDGTTSGGATEEVRRRWRRFGESGAKLICGGEAMAVRLDGRANPNQLIICESTRSDLAELRSILVQAHAERYGSADELVIGFQLTHSGRFCKPTDKGRLEPRVAYRHPILDRKFHVTSDSQVWTDAEIEKLIEDYVAAARIARDVGADFVDIKHCHGYLMHEFLSARTRPGRYGGSLENRTRVLKQIVHGIRADGNRIEIGVRLSAFDLIPFKPDPNLSKPGRPGPGIPEDFSTLLPYRYGFGVNEADPLVYDLSESLKFVDLCVGLGVKVLNVTAGSPYYNPHIQRPAAYPPSDGYLPPEDPLVGVGRQIQAAHKIHTHVAGRMVVVGSAYSYLQEYLPNVAQAVIRKKWVDVIGLGRVMLSYPTILAEALGGKTLDAKSICRTFSDCTTAPRNGMISGCYPLDKYYAAKPEAASLKEIKKK